MEITQAEVLNNNCKELELRDYLRSQYSGIFDAEGIESHIRDYVGFTFADQVLPVIMSQVSAGTKILDVGAGFGSFVIAARRNGLEAVGIEIAPFEVDYSKRRLKTEFPDINPDTVFYLGSGLDLKFSNETFDAVTLWNVVEHVPDGGRLLSETVRVLKPGGLLYLICPNYMAFRQEAHYLVPWFPMIPKGVASIYLRLLGRDPRFLRANIFYSTNWQILGRLRRLGMHPSPLFYVPNIPTLFISQWQDKLKNPEQIQTPLKRHLIIFIKRIHFTKLLELILNIPFYIDRFKRWVIHSRIIFQLYNPFKESVTISARKGC